MERWLGSLILRSNHTSLSVTNRSPVAFLSLWGRRGTLECQTVEMKTDEIQKNKRFNISRFIFRKMDVRIRIILLGLL